MAAFDIAALLVGVAGAVARPWRLPAWAVPAVLAGLVLVVGGTTVGASQAALDPLADPIAFLVTAVPLAVLLDHYGWFAALAALLTRRGAGAGGLWLLAAVVTTALNLDASVVLLTPLYVSIARRRGSDPLALAAQPVLLACLASSALPVSNLTNLIAVAATGATTAQFVEVLALPSAAAIAVGWVAYRRWSASRPAPLTARAAPTDEPPPDRRVLVTGGAIALAVLVGFTFGPDAGLQPWEVALAADAVLVAVTRRLPWKQIPLGTAVVAATLGVLAAAAAAHLPVDRIVSGTSTLAQVRVTAATALTANVANNLPALLVALPALGHRPTPALWSALVGVNMGPVLLATGSLASLLWLDTLGRLGVAARARDFSAVGVRVGLPAAVAGAAAHVALHAAGVG